MVSRAITLPPIAAWIGILNMWRGISSFSFSHMARPRAFGALAVDDHRERIHRLVIDQDRHLDQIAFVIVLDVIIEAGIAAADTIFSRS